MAFISFGTDLSAQAKARQDITNKQRLAELKALGSKIESTFQVARSSARKFGKDVGLMRDSLGRLKMVFIESVDKGKRATAKIASLPKDMGSEVDHLGGYRPSQNRFGVWPPAGYLVPMPRGYEIFNKVRRIER